MTAKKILLKDVFASISEPIKAVLTTSSKSIKHPGTKGDACEYQWILWLKTYLPKRYDVDKGFVIDHHGSISEQQDIIIYDKQYTPYLLNRDGVLYVPSESVYAVIEVKQKLTKTHIKYAGQKVASVRKLKRTSKEIKHAGGKFKAKELHRIIGGVVTLENDWKQPFGESFKSALKKLTKDEKIDMGCCLNRGSFIVDYKEKTTIISCSKDDALTFFFIKLISFLQSIGTAPAIDFEKYLKTIIKKNKTAI